MKPATINQIIQTGLIPVIRAESPDIAMRAVDAIREGGISVLEITLTVPGAIRIIEEVSRRFGDDAIVGAGTVLDSETARAHEQDPVTIDGVGCPREKLLAVLGGCLEALPAEVQGTRRFVLGRVRGLTFGVMKHRFSPPEVFLQGQGERLAPLSRESQGPRACWNALDRLFGSSEATCDEVRRELALAETKLREQGNEIAELRGGQ